MHISADQEELVYFDLFDAGHTLLSEKSFTSPAGPGIPAVSSFQSIALADVDGDGKLDLISVFANVSNPGVADRGVLELRRQRGRFPFQTGKRQVLLSELGLANTISISDLNGDHIPDLVLAAPGLALNVFLGNGDGSFQTKALPVGSSSTCASPLPPQSQT